MHNIVLYRRLLRFLLSDVSASATGNLMNTEIRYCNRSVSSHLGGFPLSVRCLVQRTSAMHASSERGSYTLRLWLTFPPSISITRTLYPISDRYTARQVQVVVFATPPCSPHRNNSGFSADCVSCPLRSKSASWDLLRPWRSASFQVLLRSPLPRESDCCCFSPPSTYLCGHFDLFSFPTDFSTCRIPIIAVFLFRLILAPCSSCTLCRLHHSYTHHFYSTSVFTRYFLILQDNTYLFAYCSL